MTRANRVHSTPRRTASSSKKPAASNSVPPPERAVPDAEDAIIRHCMTYAQNVAAVRGLFEADPTDSTYAEPAAERFCRNMKRALAECSVIPAITLFAISAKARLIPMILKDEGVRGCSSEAYAFYGAFAAEVKTLTDKLLEEERTALRANKPNKDVTSPLSSPHCASSN